VSVWASFGGSGGAAGGGGGTAGAAAGGFGGGFCAWVAPCGRTTGVGLCAGGGLALVVWPNAPGA